MSSMSQTIIQSEPYKTQGWLILNPDSQILTWVIDLYQRVKNTDTSYVDKLIKEVELGDINYIQVPDKYFTDGNTYVYTVKGLRNNGQVVAEEGPMDLVPPPPLPPGAVHYELIHTYTCVGKTYAWKLEEYKNPSNNMGYFYLTAASSFIGNNQTVIPYYQYMGQTQFSALAAQNATINGIPATDYYDIHPHIMYPIPGSIDVIMVSSDNQSYYDEFDMPLFYLC